MHYRTFVDQSYRGVRSGPDRYSRGLTVRRCPGSDRVVGVLSVLASPFWRRPAIPAGWRLLPQQVGRNGITNGDPATSAPLRNWMVERRRAEKNVAISIRPPPSSTDARPLRRTPGSPRW
nr:hypothetical protein GCM10020063_032310 [Dactylosporangium thailandense]